MKVGEERYEVLFRKVVGYLGEGSVRVGYGVVSKVYFIVI